MDDDQNLFLENQLCFPIYATSRLITRLYKPYLDEIDLTYPQYLVMLVLWEKDAQTVSDIGGQLLLNTNTVTPLLQKMKQKGLLEKSRSSIDERVVMIQLTTKGKDMKQAASTIPEKLAQSSHIPYEELDQLRSGMWKMLKLLQK